MHPGSTCHRNGGSAERDAWHSLCSLRSTSGERPPTAALMSLAIAAFAFLEGHLC